MLKLSDYNIFSKIRDSENYFIINLLNGSADILDQAEAHKIIEINSSGKLNEDDPFTAELIEKGYLNDPVKEKSLFNEKYLNFVDTRETDEVQLFFVTNYTCNFACSYCYQDEYTNPDEYPGNEVIDAFFSYIRNAFSGRKKYITVFGGEPLLPGTKQKERINYLINKANEANIELCFVTNGYSLAEYIPVLKTAKVREIQVTLDGTETMHNSRRHLKGGGPTFENIVRGVDKCLENNIPVNLRMVIDKENIGNIPDLAGFAIKKGWTENRLFKTQLGRNYELHHCQRGSGHLFSRVSLYEQLFELIKLHPEITRFYKPAYSVSKFLSENGALPDPLFDSCPACKTEWAFDYTGRIFSCTATVGKSEECLGTFYPEIRLDENKISEWQTRDVTGITECRNCSLQLACGGGCGSVARNMTGKICSSDCRPVKELLELGFAAYLNTMQD